MALAAGTRLGAYEIIGALGAGGMGEVYRATDTKLGREVAIKTLPAALASDKDRLARFEREAKLLAALNHAHIASIHSLDEHEGTQYLAMELVEGETLERKLEDGPLPVEDALHLALQIAEALEAAHEKGVVHRDLKPANIMVTANGEVKVLDFGLAKAFSGDPNEVSPAHSPALSMAMTQQGLILGTAGYMSPEQASGQATDQRADIWAFGVVLYEMLTGLPLFSGESVPHILADVLKTEPDWSRLPKDLHPRLKLLLERCLKKKVRDRYHSIADVRLDIEDVLSDPRGISAASEVAQPGRRRALPLVAATAIAAAGIAGFTAWKLEPVPKPGLESRFALLIPKNQQFQIIRGRSAIAVAPDGHQFVYSTDQGLYIRAMNELEARLIPGTEGGLSPFFSPDGRSVAYFSTTGQLMRVAVAGGAPVAICNFKGVPYGAHWEADNTILFGQAEGILRVSAAGGKTKLVIPAKPGESLYGPELLPDGDSVLFSATRRSDSVATQIVAQSISTGKRTVLVESGGDAHYLSTGHLVYALGNSLFAVAFDPRSLAVSGGSVALEKGIMGSGVTPAANYGVAKDGTLVYVSQLQRAGPAPSLNTPVWVDRQGHEESLSGCDCVQPAISPDGAHVAFTGQQDGRAAISVWSVAEHTLTRLTFEPGIQFAPVWSPDGERIAYGTADGLYMRRADGTGPVEQVLSGSGFVPSAWTADGQLIFDEGGSGVGIGDIGVVDIAGKRTQKSLVASRYAEGHSALSPDGRWLAYQSNLSGRNEVYVRPFPNVQSGEWQVSTGGGEDPKWSRDGHTLFFLSPTSLMSTAVETAPGFSWHAPKVVFDRRGYATAGLPHPYDVSPDGQRFLMIKGPNANPAGLAHIVVVENWFNELRRLLPAK